MSDHEVSMAKGQVRNSITNLKRVEKVLKTMTDKDDLPAWLQAKITDTEHNTDAAAGYMDEEVIAEKRDGKSSKDKGYSLRDWFKGGGWVQAGGKYDGKPCAKQPGQKTKPYCRDADDRAAMSKKERNKRAAKKRREDPNPNKKGKAKNVKQESFSNWRQDVQLDEFLAGKPGDGYIGHPNLDIKNPLAKKQVKREVLPGSRGGGVVNRVGATMGDRNMRLNRMLNQSHELKGDTVSEGDYRYGSYSTGRYKNLKGELMTPAQMDAYIKSKQSGKKPPVQTDKAHYEPQGELVDEKYETSPNTDPMIPKSYNCLLYTSPSPRDATLSRMPSSA